jgi:hypothetical protein
MFTRPVGAGSAQVCAGPRACAYSRDWRLADLARDIRARRLRSRPDRSLSNDGQAARATRII